MERVELENSTEVMYVHPSSSCYGRICTIHNRSNHIMRSFPQHWRSDRAMMERVCKHGIGHPDPDEYKLSFSKWEGVHACDGCCNDGISKFNMDRQE
jgi:hypothetical protein